MKRVAKPTQARWLWSVLVGLLGACGGELEPRTQLMLVADTDVPGPSAITFEIHGPGPREEIVESAFQGREDLPRTLALVHSQGDLGSFEVSASITIPNGPTLTRTHVVSFVRGKTLLVPLHLASKCTTSPPCDEGRTCNEGGACVDRQLAAEQLVAYQRAPERIFDEGASSMDAGADAATGTQDAGGDASAEDGSIADAAGATDVRECSDGQMVDVLSDVSHCGRCENACPPPPAMANYTTGPLCQGGACGLACEPGYYNCNGRANDGCEVQESVFQDSRDHCGSCNESCRGPGRRCSGGKCLEQ